MTGTEQNLEVPRKHRQRGKNRRIGFSQEVVTKNVAETLLSNEDRKLFTDSNINNLKRMKSEIKQSTNETSGDNQNVEKEFQQSAIRNKKRNKRKKDNQLSNEKDIKSENSGNTPSLAKKLKTNDVKDIVNTVEDTEQSKEIKDSGSSLSKRAMKKMKHQQVLDEKKKKLDTKLKQSAYNYLSNWKHNKTNWKFEKLKQIWLLQNLYDPSKIEESVWTLVVEYFSHSKGKVLKTILDEAIKIIENENTAENKLNRAKDLIQNLQD